MLKRDRDRQIVIAIARFGQLAPAHIREWFFHDVKSDTSSYNVINRLVRDGYIAPIERRIVGGRKGGSGQYVYQLGSNGWRFIFGGKYTPQRAVKPHTLAVADAHTELMRMERTGAITLEAYETEPDSWRRLGGADLRPDLFARVTIPHKNKAVSVWLEVDLGTERPNKIREKLEGYWTAYRNADEATMPVFPRVVFLAPDEARERELRYIIETYKPEARPLFLVSSIDDYAALLFS